MIRGIRGVSAIAALVATFAFQQIGIAAQSGTSTANWRQSPEWTKDLVIYEIATKSFTSPNGPESGTFNSLKARMAYLQELGVTGLWLTGHSLSDPRHFLNIWTQYACVEPDKIDPSLGTPDEFKSLIDEAHRRGIRIFLDVITHGVMKYSSRVKERPEWFLGEGWGGMVHFDWAGGHLDLDDWWVKIWTEYVTRYGVDGFRLDLGTTRPDLWARIRKNAFDAGHPIVIFEERNTAIPGVTDFGQANNMLFNRNVHLTEDALLLNDVSRFYTLKFGKENSFKVAAVYNDGTRIEGATTQEGALKVRLDGLTTDNTSRRRTQSYDGVPDIQLTVSGIDERRVKSIEVTAGGEPRLDALLSKSPVTWQANVSFSPVSRTLVSGGGSMAVSGGGDVIRLHLASLTHGNAIQLSSHDNGQVDFPSDQNPYSTQGSRATFGYSFLFTPMLPLFMAGEEFDASFRPLPTLSPDFFGGKNPGKGMWLYGSMLDWNELQQPRHRGMFEDTKRMIALRRQEAALLTPSLRGDVQPQLVAVPYASSIEVPAPYMRWNGNSAVIVVANRNTDAAANLKLDIPLNRLGGGADAKYKVTDLWNEGSPKVYSARQLSRLPYTVKPDRTSRGGIGLIKIELLR